jgi:hypothetical protein
VLHPAGIVNVAAVDCDEHKSIAGEHGVQVNIIALLFCCTGQHRPLVAGLIAQPVLL